jgi:hypothetical protein
MATAIATYNLTLADLAKRMDPDGKVAHIIEILTQDNEILQDASFMECNDGTTHQTTIRTGLPSVVWGRYNTGVAPSKGVTQQAKVGTGWIESKSVIDKRLAEKGGRLKEVRLSESVAHLEAMGQAAASAMFYEDERVNSDRITGIAAHYSTVNTNTAASAENVLDAGGTGSDNTSIFGVTWGDNAITGLVPQGSMAGIVHTDDGIVDVVDSTGIAGSTFKAYRDSFEQHLGVCVRDWTTSGRICNIDVSNLRAESSNADLIKLMIRLHEQMRGSGRKCFYVNRTVRTWLRIQILNRTLNNLTWETVAGKRVMVFDEVPVRVCDAILNTEARIV